MNFKIWTRDSKKSHCVVPEKNPYPPHGRSLDIPSGKGGFLKAKFPGGGGVGAKQKTFCAESMDIFWNCTLFRSRFLPLFISSYTGLCEFSISTPLCRCFLPFPLSEKQIFCPGTGYTSKVELPVRNPFYF